MRVLLTTTAALALALGAAACSKSADNTAANAEATSANGTANATTGAEAKTSDAVAVTQDVAAATVGVGAAAAAAATPAGFVDNASQSDMYEIAASKLALKRTKSPGIRKFAQAMIKAHEGTSADLKKIVAGGQAGDGKIAEKLDDRRQGLLDNLEHASDADFDARYVDQQTAAHGEALQLMDTYAKVGTNDPLKTFATNTAPHVKEHLAMVKALDHANADHDSPNGNPTKDTATKTP